MSRRIFGSLVGVVVSGALGAVLLPLRGHLDIATVALVLVIPVVVGVVSGGFVAGLVSVAAGFFVYDFVFISPYYTLTVAKPDNWTPLAVYAVVMALVARVVARLDDAGAAARSREVNTRRLFEMSELLLSDRTLPELAQSIVTSVQDVFGLTGATLLLSIDARLEVAATAGLPIAAAELARLRPEAKVPVALSTTMSSEAVQTLALAASGRPVGLLALSGVPTERSLRELLPILANHLALAVERAQLRDQAARAEVLEEIDRLRRALVGAVSHDLRTPLATIKVASSTLVDSSATLSDADTKELYGLIDLQTDRLARLVNNLLDMTRIQAGVLEVRRHPESILDLVTGTLVEMRPSLGDRQIMVEVPTDIPPVDVDRVLFGQVLGNLLENAHHHAPMGSAVQIVARHDGCGGVVISVIDRGPGVPSEQREAVFETFVRFDTGGRSGLGLALAKAFVEAHGDRIWVDDAPDGGASFSFTLHTSPLASAAAR